MFQQCTYLPGLWYTYHARKSILGNVYQTVESCFKNPLGWCFCNSLFCRYSSNPVCHQDNGVWLSSSWSTAVHPHCPPLWPAQPDRSCHHPHSPGPKHKHQPRLGANLPLIHPSQPWFTCLWRSLCRLFVLSAAQLLAMKTGNYMDTSLITR